MIIGAQLYTVRDFIKTAKSYDETLGKLAAMGYNTVQVSAIGDIGMANIRRIADKHNMSIIVTHTSPDKILDDTDLVIEDHKVLGAKYIGIGSMPMRYRSDIAGIKKFISDYTPAANKIAAAGMQLTYHNHDFEFERFDKKLMMDYLAEGFPPDKLAFVIDTFWVQAGGVDVAAYMESLAGRVDVVHFKDYAIVERERKMAPVMEGNLNWPAIVAACKKAGVKWAFVEQDNCNGMDPFECMKISFDNLKGLLEG